MNALKQAVWLFIILIALAFSGWYFASSSPLTKLDDQTLSVIPDAIVRQLTVRQYDVQGRLTHYLTAPLLQHIPKGNMHQFTSPYILMAQANQPPWEIQALSAVSLHGGERILLQENVVIHQKQGSNNEESTLKTDEITYFPKNKMATTEAKVIYERPGNIITSEGMNAYLAEKRVQLLNHARGLYEPKKTG